MDLETVMQSERSQKEKNKYCIISLICGIQGKGTEELICKAEIETQMREQTYGCQGRQGGWNELGDWDWHVYILDAINMY